MMRLFQFPGSSNILVMIVVAILVWFIGPHIHIAGSTPFAATGTRSLIVGLMVGGVLLKLIGAYVIRNRGQVIPQVKTFFLKVWDKLRYVWESVRSGSARDRMNFRGKMSQDRYRRQLKRMPWYLVMGPPQSGKKSVIAKAGLHFISADQFGRQATAYLEQFPDYSWWLTESAVMVDMKASADEETTASTFKRFIKLLRKQRKSKPISGIILTFGLTDLMMMTHQERQKHIETVSAKIRECYQNLKAQVPVYLLLTKCDMVKGFVEFFNDPSKEDSSQVWGVTLPISLSSDPSSVLQFVDQEYSQLMARLQQRVLWSLDTEKDQRGRELIHSFPQQMQLFRKPIALFIKELFASMRNIKAIQFRGLYFTSALQVGSSYDFLMSAVGKQFKLSASPKVSQPKYQENYFLRRLFHEVIFPEGKVLGYSERARKIKSFFYRTTCWLIPIVVVLFSYQMHRATVQNKDIASQMETSLQVYKLAYNDKAQLNLTGHLLTPTLKPLNALKEAMLQSQNTQWPSGFLIASHQLRSESNNALDKSLHELFLPRVAYQLGAQLTSDQNINNLYEILKGYLAFSRQNATDPVNIVPPMDFAWKDKYSLSQPEINKQLRYYINLASKDQTDKFALDSDLIQRTKLTLQRVIPSDRAYGMLKYSASESDIPDLTFVSSAGDNYLKVFDAASKNIVIRNLYTQEGFDELFRKQYVATAHQVAIDNKTIGLTGEGRVFETEPQILTAVKAKYQHDYLDGWQKALSEITVKQFTSLDDELAALKALNSENSPLEKMLDIIKDNTVDVDSDGVNVAAHYDAVNDYNRGMLSKSKMAKVSAALQSLQKYMGQLKGSNQPKACFVAAQAYMAKNSASNPIRQLSELASDSPEPIKHWLNGIADNSWQLVLQGASQYINAAWQHDVLQEYDNKHMAESFPLQVNSKANIGMDDFTHFFGPAGTLNTFFNTYISAFIDTKQTPWKLLQLNGHSLGMTGQSVKIFASLNKIQELYFADGSKTPILKFIIKPYALDHESALDKDVSMAILMVAGRPIVNNFAHPESVTYQWPFKSQKLETTIVFKNNEGDSYEAPNSPDDSQWSFFRLLNASNFKTSNQPNIYQFTTFVAHYSATFNLQSSSPVAAFKLDGLKGFRLPKKLLS